MHALVQDARYAFRIFRQNPAFTAVAIGSLALGIGANTAIFSLVDNILLKWLPVQSPQELVVLARNPADPRTGFNNPDYEYIRNHTQALSGVIASGGGWPSGMTVPDEGPHGGSQLVTNTLVSGNYFQVLGVTPAIGRLFTPDDNKTPGAHPVAVLSYDFWRTRFGGDPRVLGRRITLNGSPFTIVGVARAGFHGTSVGNSPDLYLPIMEIQQVNRSVREWNTRHFWWLNVIGRLNPGKSIQQARAELDTLLQQIEQNDPERRPAPTYDKDRNLRNRAAVLPGSQGYSYFRNRFSKPLLVLLIVVGLVLLIACANVANLLLARAASREKEIAIRLAVGAGRSRLIAQLLTEAMLLSILGGVAGAAFAWWSVRVLIALLPQTGTPFTLDLSPDLRLLGFCFGVSLLTGIVCGFMPALRATRPDLNAWLKNEVGGSVVGRWDARQLLVVAQVALCLLLLIGAGLFVRSLDNLRDLDPGFQRENVLLVDIDPARSGYDGQRTRSFYERLLNQCRTFPGVRAASLAQITPLSGWQWNGDIAIEGYQWKPDEKPYVDFNAVSPHFFETMGIPLLLGRDFSDRDNPAVTPPERPMRDDAPLPPPPPVAIINEAMARRFWGNQSPIGRRFSMGDKFKSGNSFEIVGVAGDTKYFGLRGKVESMIYVPGWRLGAGQRSLCIRTTGNPESIEANIRRETLNLDPAIPVLRAFTMEQQVNNNVSQERIVATLCSFFGGLALLLAAIGLYGLMAHTVARRTREIGIRMALGAGRRGVLWLVLRDTLLLVLAGVVIGVPAAFGLTRFVASFLYGLTPQDPATIALAAAILLATTFVAGYLPAHRAAKVDPMIALRYE